MPIRTLTGLLKVCTVLLNVLSNHRATLPWDDINIPQLKLDWFIDLLMLLYHKSTCHCHLFPQWRFFLCSQIIVYKICNKFWVISYFSNPLVQIIFQRLLEKAQHIRQHCWTQSSSLTSLYFPWSSLKFDISNKLWKTGEGWALEQSKKTWGTDLYRRVNGHLIMTTHQNVCEHI